MLDDLNVIVTKKQYKGTLQNISENHKNTMNHNSNNKEYCHAMENHSGIKNN